jgi:hypothetical protein
MKQAYSKFKDEFEFKKDTLNYYINCLEITIPDIKKIKEDFNKKVEIAITNCEQAIKKWREQNER